VLGERKKGVFRKKMRNEMDWNDLEKGRDQTWEGVSQPKRLILENRNFKNCGTWGVLNTETGVYPRVKNLKTACKHTRKLIVEEEEQKPSGGLTKKKKKEA